MASYNNGASTSSSSSGSSSTSSSSSNNENTVSSTSPRQIVANPIRSCVICQCKLEGKPSKLLLCLHTVCGTCHIARTEGGEFECPACMIKSPSAGIVENFVAHAMDAKDKPIVKCTGPNCHDEAIFHCAQCKDNLCAKCKEAHQRVRVTKDHVLTRLDRYVSGLSNMCEKHPQEELALFCNVCAVSTCRDCQLKEHHQHEYRTVESAAANCKERMTSFAKSCSEKIVELEEKHATVMERLAYVESKEAEYRSELREACTMLFEALKRRTAELSDQLKKTCDRRRQFYTNIKNPLEQTMIMTKQASSFAVAAVSLHDKQAVVRAVQFVQEQAKLTNIKHKSCKLDALQKPAETIDMQLSADQMAAQLMTFGRFIYNGQDGASTSGASSGTTNGSPSACGGGQSASFTCSSRPVQATVEDSVAHRAQVQQQQQQQSRQLTAPSHQQQNQHSDQAQAMAPTLHHLLYGGSNVNELIALNTVAARQVQNGGARPPPLVQNGRLASPGSTAQHAPSYAFGQSRPRTPSGSGVYPPQYHASFVIREPSHQQQQQQRQQPPANPHLVQQQQANFANGYGVGLHQRLPAPPFMANNRHNAPSHMAHSPTSVSSTTITPPNIVYNQMIHGSDQRQPYPGHIHPNQMQAPPRYPSPPGYPPYQMRMVTTQPTPIYIDAAAFHRQPLQPAPYVPPLPGMPILHPQPPSRAAAPLAMPSLVPAPIQVLESPSPPTTMNSCRLQNQLHTPPAARSSSTMINSSAVESTIGTVPIANSATVSATLAASSNGTDSGASVASTGQNQSEPQILLPDNSPGTNNLASMEELVAISPSALDEELDDESALMIADEMAQIEEMAQAHTVTNSNAQAPLPPPPPAVGSTAPLEESNDRASASATPAPNVSSTTTDENSRQAATPLSSAVPPTIGASGAPPPVENGVLRRMARKSINNRVFPIPNEEPSLKQTGSSANSPSVTPAPLDQQSTASAQPSTSTDGSSSVNQQQHPSSGASANATTSASNSDNHTGSGNHDGGDQSVSTTNNDDPAAERIWDDYCSVCTNGGTLVCCEAPGCLRVYCMEHHVPELKNEPSVLHCTMCLNLDAYKTPLDAQPFDPDGEDRKMTEYQLRACQRILLELCILSDSAIFREPVDIDIVQDYLDFVRDPMDFSVIRLRLTPGTPQAYKHVVQFFNDMNQVFINCDVYNTEARNPLLRQIGEVVAAEYKELVNKYFPDLDHLVKTTYTKPRPSSSGSTSTRVKRRRAASEEEDDRIGASTSSGSRRRRLVLSEDDE